METNGNIAGYNGAVVLSLLTALRNGGFSNESLIQFANLPGMDIQRILAIVIKQGFTELSYVYIANSGISDINGYKTKYNHDIGYRLVCSDTIELRELTNECVADCIAGTLVGYYPSYGVAKVIHDNTQFSWPFPRLSDVTIAFLGTLLFDSNDRVCFPVIKINLHGETSLEIEPLHENLSGNGRYYFAVYNPSYVA